MATAQSAIDKIRIQLGEKVAANSRWQDDPDLLYYLNNGRREFAKHSESVKSHFQLTTDIGATLVGQNRFARYILDPKMWELDSIYWDDASVDPMGPTGWEELIGVQSPTALGRPAYYRRIGDTIDLFPLPDAGKTLDIFGSILPPDLLLADTEAHLKDDQLQAAIDHATAMALFDDDRDGTIYVQRFANVCKQWKKKVHLKGPQFINILGGGWYE